MAPAGEAGATDRVSCGCRGGRRRQAVVQARSQGRAPCNQRAGAAHAECGGSSWAVDGRRVVAARVDCLAADQAARSRRKERQYDEGSAPSAARAGRHGADRVHSRSGHDLRYWVMRDRPSPWRLPASSEALWTQRGDAEEHLGGAAEQGREGCAHDHWEDWKRCQRNRGGNAASRARAPLLPRGRAPMPHNRLALRPPLHLHGSARWMGARARATLRLTPRIHPSCVPASAGRSDAASPRVRA